MIRLALTFSVYLVVFTEEGVRPGLTKDNRVIRAVQGMSCVLF